jgi:putative hemolysin
VTARARAYAPRNDVDWIDLSAGADAIREGILSTTHSRLPGGERGPDKISGVVTTRELLAGLLSDKPFDVKAYVRRGLRHSRQNRRARCTRAVT